MTIKTEVGRGLIDRITVTVYGPVEKTHKIMFWGSFRLQMDDICIAPAIINLYFILSF